MMARFCAYAQKVFRLSERFPTLTDSRTHPRIRTAAAFASVLTLFATRRGSLNGLERDLRIPARLRAATRDRTAFGRTGFAQLGVRPDFIRAAVSKSSGGDEGSRPAPPRRC